MKLFDAHCHLQDPRLNLDDAMVRAREAGVAGFACCGTRPDDWHTVADLAQQASGVFPFFGVHPWFLDSLSKAWRDQLAQILAERTSGLGEIGLDHALKDRDDALQERVFAQQMELSRDLGIPVAVHCRRAWGRLVSMLTQWGPHPRGIVLHSFSGSHELVAPLAKLGAYFSFSGTLTYHRNKRAHQAAQTVPLDRLLLETDAPDLLPVIPGMTEETRRTAVNQPANLVWVVKQAARLRDMTEPELAEVCWGNAVRLFHG